jgi:hypothetical protein
VRAVKGLHQLLRQRIGFLGLLAFMLLPWINFNGQQAVLFDLIGQKYNILGRGLIIHADEDDCGRGGNKESLKTGNAGKRIGCAVIGYAKTK